MKQNSPQGAISLFSPHRSTTVYNVSYIVIGGANQDSIQSRTIGHVAQF